MRAALVTGVADGRGSDALAARLSSSMRPKARFTAVRARLGTIHALFFAAVVLLGCMPHEAGPRELEVRFASDGVLLAGTLSLPALHAHRRPAVVFVTGDGLQDRDSGLGPA